MWRVFSNCALLFGGFFLFAITAAHADDEAPELTFCSFGPRVNVVDIKPHSGTDPCADHVHVQGVLWECGAPEEVRQTGRRFLDQLNERGKEECRKHCENLGDRCRSFFSEKSSCGLGTDRDEAIALGKKEGCRKDCNKGRAFTYCSIYNAGYQGPNPERVLSQAPNCECRSAPSND